MLNNAFFLPVVDGGELAILHQLVPEAGEALAGENLFRVGSWKRFQDKSRYWLNVLDKVRDQTCPGSTPTHLESSRG